MKFLCVGCDRQMEFAERREPGDGTFAAQFTCPDCGRSVALLANAMETQLVGSLGVKIGGEPLEASPMEFVRDHVEGGALALTGKTGGSGGVPTDQPARPVWSEGAIARLERVPVFVRGMVKRIYLDYASQRGIAEITTDVMDRARSYLGLEGM